MTERIKSESSLHSTIRRNLLIVSLIIVLFVASLVVYVSVISIGGTHLDNAIHVKSEDELNAAINNASFKVSTDIVLDDDIKLTQSIVIPNDKDITLSSNRDNGFYRLIGPDGLNDFVSDPRRMGTDDGNVIVVLANGVLRLNGVIVTHDKGAIGMGVFVNSDGTLIMTEGEISGNKDVSAGGVYNNGIFIMLGGVISGNTASLNGGGVYNAGGTFEMHGGRISSNVATGVGGGVWNSGEFSMFGGEISNNKASDGGGVFVYVAGTFDMSGGKIVSNTALNEGGGVSISPLSNFRLSNGEISNNKAVNGGGIYSTRGTINLSGGKVSNNNASKDGGGVYNIGGVFEMHDGKIADNKANNGGGVYNIDYESKLMSVEIHSDGMFNMSGGEIANNTATNEGGGIYNKGTFNKYNGEISNNTANTGKDIYEP